MKITLCLLTLNEIEGCKHDVPKIKRGGFEKIYAVDGGSKDGTIEFLHQQKIPVYVQKIKGYNPAHILAVEKCRTDAIIFFHPKGSVPVSNTLKFRKFFEQGYEFVVASRIIKNGRNEEDKKILKPRKWLTLILAVTASLIWRRNGNLIWDVLHGFRGASVKAFKKINPKKFGRTIDIEEVIESYRKDIKRIEFPTRERSRISGQTHFKTIPFGLDIMKYLFRKIFAAN